MNRFVKKLFTAPDPVAQGFIDDDGKDLNGLHDTVCPEYAGEIDEQQEWEESIDFHEDEFTGEALIDNDVLQQDMNDMEMMGIFSL